MGCRKRPPSILGFGGPCSGIVFLTTSLKSFHYVFEDSFVNHLLVKLISSIKIIITYVKLNY